MAPLTRRSFVAGLTTIPFALWFERYAIAAPVKRYDVLSPNGQLMLKKYAAGVKKMMSTTDKDPRSWVFQWYTHWVKGAGGSQAPQEKTNAINSIYGPTPNPWRSLAVEMWETCQAHGPGMDENSFLPWHRMFLYFFERIVRSVTDPSFTLPYWNYSVVGTAHGVLPKGFRMQGDPTFGSLFVQKRNVANVSQGFANVNGGQPIDKNDPGSLDLTALAQCKYQPNGAQSGFNMELDQGLHGNVHVLLGNTQNMGRIPWAAGDPIFWMHHCNIDRLWASWNKAGRQNPSGAWLTKQFVFADENGNRVMATVKDFNSITQLNYTYDRFEPVPACLSPVGPEALATPQTRAVAPGGPVELGNAPVRVNLAQPPGPEGAAVPLRDRVRQLKPGKRMYAVLKNLNAEVAPGVVYHVYFDVPAGYQPKPGKRDPYYVGTLNFFESHSGHEGEEGSTTPKFRSLDVTAVAKRLQRTNKLSAQPSLTIAPTTPPEADARPIIGEISIVEQ